MGRESREKKEGQKVTDSSGGRPAVLSPPTCLIFESLKFRFRGNSRFIKVQV